MRPHSNDLHNPFIFENLVDQSMLDIDPARICPSQITNKFFVSGRSLEGIDFKNFEEFLGFGFQPGRREFLSILLSLSGVDKRPRLHQTSSGEHFSMGVLRP